MSEHTRRLAAQALTRGAGPNEIVKAITDHALDEARSRFVPVGDHVPDADKPCGCFEAAPNSMGGSAGRRCKNCGHGEMLHTMLPGVPLDHCGRCNRCGWQLAERPEAGCTRGNCACRPLPYPRDTCAGCGARYYDSAETRALAMPRLVHKVSLLTGDETACGVALRPGDWRALNTSAVTCRACLAAMKPWGVWCSIPGAPDGWLVADPNVEEVFATDEAKAKARAEELNASDGAAGAKYEARALP